MNEETPWAAPRAMYTPRLWRFARWRRFVRYVDVSLFQAWWRTRE